MNQKVSGALLFLAAFVTLMGIITAEAFYPPGYSTADNEISDLGSTRPPESLIFQPSATIFNSTMWVAGLLIITATYFLYKSCKRFIIIIPLGLLGIGVLGVGIFPGNVATFHPLFAMTTFIAGGVAAILSSRVVSPPFSYIAIVLGLITLFTLFFAGLFIPILGDGRTERWVAYPVVMWLSGFGGYLMNSKLSN